MSSKESMREFTRVSIAFEVTVVPTDNGENVIKGFTRDLSMKGIYVISEDKLPAGTKCHVSLVPSGDMKHFHIEANAKVARVSERGMGIEFIEIMGLESFEHLRNIVLYNSRQEIEQVEEEFKKHLGIKKRD